MAETLLNLSKVLLFGREVEDLQIFDGEANGLPATVATTANVADFKGTPTIDEEEVAAGDIVLARAQDEEKEKGRYTVLSDPDAVWPRQVVAKGGIVHVDKGTANGKTFWRQKLPLAPGKQRFEKALENRGRGRGLGKNKQLDLQLDVDARFARIYGFSYEGAYYELPNSTLFLVHGDGESATDGNQPGSLASRAPNDPSQSGVGAADFQIANDIMVWAYDKADYTIRMDVESGMFEQVLLDVMFDGGGPGGIAGANVRGANVRGANVRGANVRGANVRGANVRGANVRGGGGGD
jgi:hypothetical protein